MLTVKRNEYERGYSDVAVLEREGVISGYQILDESNDSVIETPEETRERKSRNLDKLLNYELYKCDQARSEQAKLDELIKQAEGISIGGNEDPLTPSSTTMQFQDKAAEDFYQNAISEEKFTFKLNTKGKLLIAAYAIVVAVILAFIVLNTGVINTIQAKISQKSETAKALQSEYYSISTEVDKVSSDEYVINKAVNEYNMSK